MFLEKCKVNSLYKLLGYYHIFASLSSGNFERKFAPKFADDKCNHLRLENWVYFRQNWEIFIKILLKYEEE